LNKFIELEIKRVLQLKKKTQYQRLREKVIYLSHKGRDIAVVSVVS